jgi:predicted NBD/HSP70 family sugar kinase
VIGLDVGGANTKAAVVDAAQRMRIVSEPFEVWREPEGMADVIASVVGRSGLGGAPVAVVTDPTMRPAPVRHNNAVLPPDRTGRSDDQPPTVNGQRGAWT